MSRLLPRRPATWTLRTRLLACLIALLAAVSLVIGLVSVLALSSFLQHRLDSQLAYAERRAYNFTGQPAGRTAGGVPVGIAAPRRVDAQPSGGPLGAPGQGEGTLGVLLSGGTVVRAGVLDPGGVQQALSPAQTAQLLRLPTDGRPRTVDLGGRLGAYRLEARSTSTPGETVITGLPLSPVRATVVRLAVVVGVVSLAGLLAAALLGALIIRLTLRPLRRVVATAGRVAELPLDRGAVALAVRVPEADTDQRTEVGRVGAALNRMLGHVAAALSARQASEARVRQFVADASHELRTPLAAIRGYAELTRRSRHLVPEDVAHALGRVEAEAVRMTALVDDLLLLARLDEGRPVEREPVDLSRLLVDAVGDAHVAGRHHRWRLDMPEEPVQVTGDAARLHQAVANLLSNARTHTPAGTEVITTLGVEGDRAIVRVTDDGPGIPESLQPDVFERFARGDGSRSRVAGGTGLGLAIVAAVVTAHDGDVGLESRPGRTRFTVRLPLGARPPDAGQPADAAQLHHPLPA